MDITVYLPDALRQRAKDAHLNLSRMLREAVEEELERRKAVEAALDSPQTFEVKIDDSEGNIYTGRITGTSIAEDHDAQVFLTDDERVILYDAGQMKYWVLDDPEEELRDQVSPEAYRAALTALGLKPIIDL